MGEVVEHHITRYALREEKVGPENFELLKVLGTGGKERSSFESFNF